jgi:L-aspartate oxidase
VRFDLDDNGKLRLGREAAHSRRRIAHAGGDATGRELVRFLTAAVRDAPWIDVRENTFVEDLLQDGDRIVGALTRHETQDGEGPVTAHAAGAVVLATGGIGQLYRYTTNPPECTGDGLAMAARCGARLADLEFVQFHPTALACDDDPLPLLTEALRGEGAILVDETGRRFMKEIDARAELAPRDLVARAIWQHRRHGHDTFLDATGSVGEDFPSRFPSVFACCQEHGIDPRREPIPVTPAAHYHMGGVVTDLDGRTSLPGLWACGEVACTGVHGANRLASNSLLEGLVFGQRIGRSVIAADRGPPAEPACSREWSARGPGPRPAAATAIDLRRHVRDLLWREAGLVRDEEGMQQALSRLLEWRALGLYGELGNLVQTGLLITAAALRRKESRGAHFRRDFPVREDGTPERHSYRADELIGAVAPAAAALAGAAS